VQMVDAVFLTHPHNDHAGALSKLLSRVRPNAIYVPVGWFDAPDMSSSIAEAMEAAKEENIPILPLLPGDTFELRGGLTIRVEDTGHTSSNDNDLFLLLRAEYRGKSFLFTGDMEANDEPEEISPCDVLKVAHHGAKSSTSEGFLLQTQPEYAVLSVGQNSYGHPHPDVVARINAVNSTIYRTDEDGAIRMTLDRSSQIQVKTYKNRTEG
jgi:Predicted hydrolase (metallo-beta-lactamase superfamily)